MSVCERFEREGLLRLERGEPLDPHFDRCDDCRDARARYREVVRAIAGSAAKLTPPRDFEARVFAAIARRRTAARLRWPIAVGAGLLSAALVLALLWRADRDPDRPALALVQSIERSAATRPVRGESAAPGDLLHLRLAGGPAELRVYREGGGLVHRCADAPACALEGNGVATSVRLDVRGDYQAIAIPLAGAALPAATGDLDADLAALEAAGARVLRAPAVQVR
jgi:hypothetical protein